MEYKELKILSVISIIAGTIIVFVLLSLINTCGYYVHWEKELSSGYYLVPQTELVLALLYSIILTLLVLVIYPILYIRKHNPNKLKKSPKEPTIQVREAPKSIYCPECGVEILDITKEYCSQCGNKIIFK